jgi:hypothetical protein
MVALRGRGSSTGMVQSHHCNFGSILLETWLENATHQVKEEMLLPWHY